MSWGPRCFEDKQEANPKAKNQAELKRCWAAGSCFKCRVSRANVTNLPFLECPLHGAQASDPDQLTVGRTLATPAQKRC